MIDYEKLKIAHELQKKLCLGSSGSLTITVRIIVYGDGKVITDYMTYDGNISTGYYTNLDDIIIELTELTQPQPKYKDCSKVWFCDSENNLHECTIINYCNVNKQYILNDDCVFRFLASENRLFPTKLALIQAQCDHWKSEKMKYLSELGESVTFDCQHQIISKYGDCVDCGYEKKECQHESDGNCYTSDPSKYKCKLCGEFYR